MSKEPLPRVKYNSIKITPNSELNKNVIYETPREKRGRIRNENKQTTRFLSPNYSPVDNTTNLRSHVQPTTNPLPHVIEPDDHVINNAQHEHQINAVLQDLGEILECHHLMKGPDASM